MFDLGHVHETKFMKSNNVDGSSHVYHLDATGNYFKDLERNFNNVETLAKLEIHLSSKLTKHTRIVCSFLDAFGDVGGCLDFLALVFGFLLSFHTSG